MGYPVVDVSHFPVEADAVRRLRPYAVDASSGVETNGYKDGEKMRALVRAVREASGAAPGGLTE